MNDEPRVVDLAQYGQKVLVYFDGDQPRIRAHGVEQLPGGSPGSGAQLNHGSGLGHLAEIDETLFEKT